MVRKTTVLLALVVIIAGVLLYFITTYAKPPAEPTRTSPSNGETIYSFTRQYNGDVFLCVKRPEGPTDAVKMSVFSSDTNTYHNVSPRWIYGNELSWGNLCSSFEIPPGNYIWLAEEKNIFGLGPQTTWWSFQVKTSSILF